MHGTDVRGKLRGLPRRPPGLGYTTTNTTVLPNPLSGPAYFVSHGSAQYTELVVVLQGDMPTELIARTGL